MGLLGWALMVVSMVGLIFLVWRGKNDEPTLPRSRWMAIGAGIFGLGQVMLLVGAALDRDLAAVVRYAILLGLLATLVLVSRRRSAVSTPPANRQRDIAAK